MTDAWFQEWYRLRGMNARWIDFVKKLCVRFGERNIADVIKEFNKLEKEGSVTGYQEKFEELRALMWNAQPTLIDQHFVSSFISGLKDELRSMVKIMMPTTVR